MVTVIKCVCVVFVMYMILITYVVTVIKCVASSTQTTENAPEERRRTPGNVAEGHHVRSTVAFLLWDKFKNDGVSWSITLLTTSDQESNILFVVMHGRSNSSP